MDYGGRGDLLSRDLFAVGVDLGGTKIATGVTDLEGRVIQRIIAPTEPEYGAEHVIGNICRSVEDAISRAGVPRDKIVGIGVGSPGPLDPRSGIVIFAPNLKWKNVPLKAMIEASTKLPVWVGNDANLAALGEMRFGAGKGSSNMIYITVSTGIGGGLIINGEVFEGTSFIAGEVGHIVIVPDGPRCGCGNYGCLEAVASGTAIARVAREHAQEGMAEKILSLAGGDPDKISAKIVAQAADQGDEEAISILNEAFTYLGLGIVTLLNLLNPEVIVIGGGVSQIGARLFGKVQEVVSKRAIKAAVDVVRIVPSALGQDVGLVGAAALAIDSALNR
ncbi:MAG TPA: ROK family protein [Firmicutes bacterium]|nr:ROK family protein [Bacillota bacterium]HHY97553.1 ROK family protein [Bacillota bacterium]